MDPYSMILLAYLQVAQCLGMDHPKPNPPVVTILPVKKFRCSASPTGKCIGLYTWPSRRIKIAGESWSISLLQHEMAHDLLWQREGRAVEHRAPEYRDCVTGTLDDEADDD